MNDQLADWAIAVCQEACCTEYELRMVVEEINKLLPKEREITPADVLAVLVHMRAPYYLGDEAA